MPPEHRDRFAFEPGQFITVRARIKDLAAGQRFLREQGYQNTVLLGISGGAALATMWSASTAGGCVSTAA